MSGPSGGGRIYGQHGSRHAPRGSDPAEADRWRNVLDSGSASAWSSGTNYSAGDEVTNGDLLWEAIRASGPGNGGAVQPGVASSYVAYWWCQGSIFVNGSNMSPTVAIPDPVPMRYRISVGPPNYLEVDGSISFYTEHQVEIQGDVTGLLPADVVFIIPPEYRHSYDVPIPTHDESGFYVPCRLLASGEFIWGKP